jgi:UDP-glucose 4-epimerase
MERILLTGASGFIGRALLEKLNTLGYEIAIISRRNIQTNSSVNIFNLSLKCKEDVFRVFESYRPDIVIHHAAELGLFSAEQDLLSNVLPSIHLIDACCQYKTGRFLYASSGGALYGNVPEGALASEDQQIYPRSIYAAGKLAVESYLHAAGFNYDLEYSIFRYSNVFGVFNLTDEPRYIIPRLIKAALANQPLAILGREQKGDEGYIRDFIPVDSVVQANLLWIRGIIKGHIINVCSGESTSMLFAANTINNFFGHKSAIEFLDPVDAAIKRSVLNPDHIKRYLEIPKFEESMFKILNQLSENIGINEKH